MSTPYPPSTSLEWDGWLTVQTASRGYDCPLRLHASQLGTAVAGNNESEMKVAGNGGKRGWRLEEGLLWPKRSDCSIGGSRGILDPDNKDACG